jgi:hypothetical protein
MDDIDAERAEGPAVCRFCGEEKYRSEVDPDGLCLDCALGAMIQRGGLRAVLTALRAVCLSRADVLRESIDDEKARGWIEARANRWEHVADAVELLSAGEEVRALS